MGLLGDQEDGRVEEESWYLRTARTMHHSGGPENLVGMEPNRDEPAGGGLGTNRKFGHVNSAAKA
jgi:hypothetical protein